VSEVAELLPLAKLKACLRKVISLNILINIEPKPAKCFSILGVKSLSGQRTFNVECEKEEDCIKYVDYISILIQNYKSAKEDSSTPSSRTESISFSPFENMK